jgi:hypothetical protein
VLALGLGLVVNEFCILLAIRCLRAPCLYSMGLVVLQDHTNRVCGVATLTERNKVPIVESSLFTYVYTSNQIV